MIVFSKIRNSCTYFDEYFDEINSIEDFELKLKRDLMIYIINKIYHSF